MINAMPWTRPSFGNALAGRPIYNLDLGTAQYRAMVYRKRGLVATTPREVTRWKDRLFRIPIRRTATNRVRHRSRLPHHSPGHR